MLKANRTQPQNTPLRHPAPQRDGGVSKRVRSGAGKVAKGNKGPRYANLPMPLQVVGALAPRSLEAMRQPLPEPCPSEVALARAFLELTPAERDYLDGPVHFEMQRAFATLERLQKALPQAPAEKAAASQPTALYDLYFNALRNREWLVAIDELRRSLDTDSRGNQLMRRLLHATPDAATNARLAEATARILLSLNLSELSVKATAQAARSHELAGETRAAAAACACVAEGLSRFPEPNFRLIEAAWRRALCSEPQNAHVASCHKNALANLANSQPLDRARSGVLRAPHSPSSLSLVE